MSEAITGVGWHRSGLQKTTSTDFEGRWEGESTRSAYLFFHNDRWPSASIDVFLDETSRGLRGNLALVCDVRPLWELENVPDALSRLGELSGRHLPGTYRRPVTLRLRQENPTEDVGEAELETRLKLHLPRGAIAAGYETVEEVISTAVRAFESVLRDPQAARVLDLGSDG